MQSAFAANILDGQVAFLTGGTSGINLGIARRFVEAGAKVALLGRNAEKAANAARLLNDLGKPNVALALTADVRDPAALGAALQEAVAKLGPLDILLSGAAGNFPAPALGMSPNGFKSVVDIDLLGTFNTFRLGYEHLKKPGARAIAISAPQAGAPTMMQAHVCAAKAGIDMLVKTLALEWGGAGVTVNSIWPGAVADTEGMARLAPTDADRERLEKRLPLQRFATAAEIAEMALFLVSTSGAYATGATFVLDGGMTLIGMNALLHS
jgi:NAD(P)-dependent dehydrogenase (short-subunit alcohol dehydrogenase family)